MEQLFLIFGQDTCVAGGGQTQDRWSWDSCRGRAGRRGSLILWSPGTQHSLYYPLLAPVIWWLSELLGPWSSCQGVQGFGWWGGAGSC